MPESNTLGATQEVIGAFVRAECLRRNRLYRALRVDIEDETPKEDKVRFLFQTLQKWAREPLEFIRDCAWAHDSKGRFGAGSVPKGIIAPPGMVPFRPYKKQIELIEMWDRFQTSPTEEAAVIEKSRQVFATGLLAGWLPLHAWLFQEGGKTGVTSYEEDMIDRGGKGQRTEETLFGALRSYLDALVHCIPELRFNKRYKRKFDGDMTQSGLRDAQDTNRKLTRPQWWVHGERMFAEAERNFIVGDSPGDSLFRGLKLRNAILDEFAQFNDRREGVDKDSWSSCQAAAKNRIAPFTLPKKGGTASFPYQLCHNEEFAKVASQISFHWSEVAPYMADGAWICRACGHENPHPPNHPPGREGVERACGLCDLEQRVVFKDMTSPWFRKMSALALGDRTMIAREYQLDWMASQGDVLFSTLNHHGLVRRHNETKGTWVTLEGFDPGWSMKNPAAWISSRFDPVDRRVVLVGYWRSDNPHPEYWVPFMKHWNRRRVMQSRMPYGKFGGQTWMEAFQYPPEALEVLDLVSRYPLGSVEGDKFGSHKAGGTSHYEVLADYRIFVHWIKTKDREKLVGRGIEWATRMSIDDRIADLAPPTPLGGRFPTVKAVFQTAKPKPQSGQAEYRIDVDKQDPPHVHDAADAWFYLCRHLEQVRVSPNVNGDWATVSEVGRSEVTQDTWSQWA